jgi:hypothetical protein
MQKPWQTNDGIQQTIHSNHNQGQSAPIPTPTTGGQTPSTTNGNLQKTKYQPKEHQGKQKALAVMSATAKNKAKAQRLKE